MTATDTKTMTAWVGALGVIVGGAVYIGSLSTRMEILEQRAHAAAPLALVAEATQEAVRAVRETGEQFLSFDDPQIEEFGWSHCGDPVRMIRVDEGLCFITRFAGRFNGNGEWVQIRQQGDYWYLHGNSHADAPGSRLYIEAKCWRFPGVPVAAQ